MRKSGLFVGVLFCLAAAFGQTTPAIQPDCQFRQYLFTGTTTTVPINNVNIGCVTWVVEYQAEGFSAINLIFEAAPAINLTTTPSPGAWLTWAGHVDNGVNPQLVSPGKGVARFSDAVSSGDGYYASFVRLNLSSATGSGSVIATVYGYKSVSAGSGGAGGGGSGGCVGTAATPCIVTGPDAPGAVSTKNPVQVAGNDGTDVQSIKTDTSGQTIPANASSANADNLSNTQVSPTGAAAAGLIQRVFPYVFDSATWDRQFKCTSQQAFTLSAGTDVVVATGVSSTNSYLCHLSFSGDSAQTVTIRQGTGTTCLTNTATLAGPYANGAAIALDFSPYAALTTTVQARDICLHFGGSITAGGVAIFAAF